MDGGYVRVPATRDKKIIKHKKQDWDIYLPDQNGVENEVKVKPVKLMILGIDSYVERRYLADRAGSRIIGYQLVDKDRYVTVTWGGWQNWCRRQRTASLLLQEAPCLCDTWTKPYLIIKRNIGRNLCSFIDKL
jgi:hypothetical protein